MKDQTSFNPVPTPDNPNPSLKAGTAQEQTSQSNSKLKRVPKRNAKRKSPRTEPSDSTTFQADSETRRSRIKGCLAAKVTAVDQEKLQEVLLGCGVAVGIVASVVLAIKLMPLATLILAVFGLAVALRLWGLLPFLPRPF